MNEGKCLWGKHNISTVRDACGLATITQTPGHLNRTSCACVACREIRHRTKCGHPNRCYTKAMNLLDTLCGKRYPRITPR